MEEQQSAALKQQLRDVHLPDDVSWWPLAYGWWVLLILSLLGVTALVCYFLRRRKKNAYRHSAINELKIAYALWQQQNDGTAYLQSANAILKRTVLHFTHGHGAASQSGNTWLKTLAYSASDELSAELKNALALQVYQANTLVDINVVHQELCHWLKTHKASDSLPELDSKAILKIPSAKFTGSAPASSEVDDA